MIGELKPYAEYKESGLSWLGQVPRHWDVRRLRASITDCVNGIWGADPNGKDDLICIRVADFDRVNLRVRLKKQTIRAIPISVRSRRLLKRSDLLLEKSGGGDLQPVGAVVVYDRDELAVCSNFVARMPLAYGYDSFYVNYLHSTLYAHRVNVRSIKQTTGIQNLDGKAYLAEPVAFPPLDEQAAIVRFLDWGNGRLERAIRAKRKVITLLNEQKQAIIHCAVTRGLDPDVPLKPSGIPWLGDIPQHWDLLRSKYLFREVDERSVSGQETHLSMSQKLGLVPNTSIEVRRLVSDSYAGAKLCQPMDLVLNRLKAHLGVFALASQPGLVSPDYTVLRPVCEMCPAFFEALYRSPGCRRELFVRAKGIVQGFWRLYTDDFYNIVMPVPPVEEQRSIMARLSVDLRQLNIAISRLESEIELLREYRTRLVADVVTGTLDVREAATRLPDEAAPDLVADDTEVAEEFDTEAEETAA